MTSDMPPSPGEPGAALSSSLDSAQLRNARKAFKQELKLTRRDDEARRRSPRGVASPAPRARGE
jgi:hypothetical protein